MVTGLVIPIVKTAAEEIEGVSSPSLSVTFIFRIFVLVSGIIVISVF